MLHGSPPEIGDQKDRELLQRFLRERDAQAFAVLIERHGPTVLGVCRRLLRNAADADDAFQATFMTLLRKGHTIRRKTALPSWLYRVAVRIALRHLRTVQKHGPAAPLPDLSSPNNPADEAAWREAVVVIDGELQSLPESYRAPLLLCCVEGRSYEEAATELGCPVGTVGIRLMRGRELLRRRLVRRGLMLGAGLVATNLIWPWARAQVSHELCTATLATARYALDSGVTTPAVSPNVLRMLDGQRRWWQARVPLPLLTVSVVSFLTTIFVAGTFQNSHKARLTEGVAHGLPAAPIPAASPEIKPTPGLWIQKKRGTGFTWVHSSKLGKDSQPHIGPDGDGEVIGIAIITKDLRWVQARQIHEGIVVLNNFFWVNYFIHL
jgi:RNA polymerase sigma factor (sigma-70 family)